MTRLRHITLALLALCAFAASAAPAYAQDGNYHHVIRECYDTGQLDGSKYTRSALKNARKHLPSDIKEYSDCEDLINAALAAAGRGNRGSGGGGGGYAPPPNPAYTTPSGAIASNQQDYDALNKETNPQTRTQAPPAVDVAGKKLTPSTGGVINSASHGNTNDVPLPLILALAALAAMAAFGLMSLLRRRWPDIRRVAPRLVRR